MGNTFKIFKSEEGYYELICWEASLWKSIWYWVFSGTYGIFKSSLVFYATANYIISNHLNQFIKQTS